MDEKSHLDLVIAGFPKCGTSSLFRWLEEHPQLEGTTPKETFFFMDPGHPLCGRHGLSIHENGLKSFSHFFQGKRKEGVLRFEGTTHNFYQRAARETFGNLPVAPFVVMALREPADRLHSSFRFTRDVLAYCDRKLTFDQYVDDLLAKRTKRLRKHYFSASSFWIAERELDFGKYVKWLDSWREALPPGKLYPIVFERLREQPEATMKELCVWLAISPNRYTEIDFHAKNRTYSVKYPLVHRVARRVAPIFSRVPVRALAKSVYLQWQEQNATEEEHYKEGLERIRRYFAPWNQELEDRYCLKLRQWWGKEAFDSI